jgi:hypothetical protein
LVQRAIGIQDAGLATEPAEASLQPKHPQSEHFQSDDILAYGFSRRGEMSGSVRLETGLPLFVSGMLSLPQGRVVYGSNGFNPWWGTLR